MRQARYEEGRGVEKTEREGERSSVLLAVFPARSLSGEIERAGRHTRAHALRLILIYKTDEEAHLRAT